MYLIFMIFSVSFGTIVSQLILKKGILLISTKEDAQFINFSFFLKAFSSPLIWTSLILQGITFCLWMFVISKQKLGMAFGMSGAFFYLLLPLFAWLIYDEHLTHLQWVGLFFITCGIVMMQLK